PRYAGVTTVAKRKLEQDDCVVERGPVEVDLLEEVAVPGATPLVLQKMGGAVSRYAGLSVDHRRPCTSQEGRLCHIFGSLKAWNSFLWMIGMELQEKSVSELSLVKASDGTRLTGSATVNEKVLLRMYLYHLIAEHHCVVEATISDDILADHQDTICHAIRDSRGLKRITLAFGSLRLLFSWAHLAEAIGSMTHLESLSLHGIIHGDLLANLAPMLAASASLTVFHASDMHVRDPPVNVFMEGLSKNRSITELSLTTKALGRGIWRSGSRNRGLGLDTYLRANTSLTSLNITAPRGGTEIDVRTVCTALSENTVLTRLELELHRLKSEYATPIKCLLSSSKTLKYFSLSYQYIDRSGTASNERQYPVDVVSPMQYCPQCRTDHSEVTNRVRPWIIALLTDEFVAELLKPEFEHNYTLHSLKFSYMCGEMMKERLAIQDIVHRNRALTKRAASYVTGTSAKYTADAFEKVSESSALIEELQSVASIEEARANELVAESTLRLADFTEFMRLAGVVFDSVECNPSEDGKVQLADLPELCLRRIRKFLRLSDVLDGQH
ncbi:hypothetical protein V5799_014073, partial [Amblyomma americanum]